MSGSGPTSVVGQSGEMLRVVTWINAAWMDIQTRMDHWLWARSGFSFSTIPGTNEYSPASASITDFADWDTQHVRVYKDTTANEFTLTFMPYDDFRHVYMRGVIPTGKPSYFTITPNKSLHFYPTPNDAYTIYGDYYKAASELSGNSDTPVMPERFHRAIVYGALMKYAVYESASDLYAYAKMEYDRILSDLRRSYLPTFSHTEPLV